jgi:hypothetical protein
MHGLLLLDLHLLNPAGLPREPARVPVSRHVAMAVDVLSGESVLTEALAMRALFSDFLLNEIGMFAIP